MAQKECSLVLSDSTRVNNGFSMWLGTQVIVYCVNTG